MNTKMLMLLSVTALLCTSFFYIPCGNADSDVYMQNTLSTDWWSMYKHDAHRTGYTTSFVYEQKNILFAHPLSSSIISSPVVFDGNVFIGTIDGRLYCLNATNGAEEWNFQADGEIRASFAISDGKIYFAADRYVYSVDINTGTQVWKSTFTSVIETSPVITDGKVIIASMEGAVYALSTDTGQPTWRYPSSGHVGNITSSPAAYSNLIFTGCFDSKLYVINVADGSLEWTFDADAEIMGAPVISNDRVIFGTSNGTLYSVDIATHQKVWNRSFKSPFDTSPVVANNKVYAITFHGDVLAFNENDGSDFWQQYVPTNVYRPAALSANNKLIFGGMDGNVYCVDALTGNINWTYATTGPVMSAPAIAMNRIYIGSEDWRLYCLGEGKPYLSVKVTPRESVLKSGESTYLRIEVREPVNHQPESATLTFESQPMGSFTNLVQVNPGEYEVTFTAPDVSVETQCRIKVTAQNRPSYSDGIGNTEIIVQPLPAMKADMWSDTPVMNSQSATRVHIYVTDMNDNAITGASVELNASIGTLDRTTGQTDEFGRFYTIYTAPWVESVRVCTITANISHQFYTNTSASIDIQIIPVLMVSITADNPTLVEGTSTTIKVDVSDGVNVIADASVILTADVGSFDYQQGLTDETGRFSAKYTAPLDIVTASNVYVCKIIANVSKQGYANGSACVDIEIHDKSAKVLKVDLTVEPSEILPEGTALLKVKVTDMGTGDVIEDAYLTLAATDGSLDKMSGYTDLNGEFTTSFTAPSVSVRTICRITVTASKSGWEAGTGEIDVIVNPELKPKVLNLSVNVESPTLSMRNKTTISIKITDSATGDAVENADISITTTAGRLSKTSGKSDELGELDITFTPPSLTAEQKELICIINVSASKLQYNTSTATTYITVKYDNVKPFCKITSPADGAEVSDIVIIKGTASDPDGDTIQYVQIRISAEDGETELDWTTVEGTTDWGFEWDTKSKPTPDGKYIIHVRAYDGYEHSIAASITLIVKNEKPFIPGFEITAFIIVILVLFLSYKVVDMKKRKKS